MAADQVHSTAQQIGDRIGWNPIDAATQPPAGTRERVLNLSDPRTDYRNLGFEDSCLSGAPPPFSRRFGQVVDAAVARIVSHSSLGYGLLLGFFGTGAVLGAVLLQRLRKTYSVEAVVAVATAVFACVLAGAALLHSLWILSLFSFFGGAAWTIFMSVFNTLIQRLAPDWVRARVLAVYLFVFQGSMAIGSVLWGALAERAGLEKALLSTPSH
jgi:MFS family permease